MLMNIRVPRAHTGTLYWDRVNRIVSPAQLATTVEPKDSVLSLGNAQQVEDLFTTSSFNFDQVRLFIHGPFNSRLRPTYKFWELKYRAFIMLLRKTLNRDDSDVKANYSVK